MPLRWMASEEPLAAGTARVSWRQVRGAAIAWRYLELH